MYPTETPVSIRQTGTQSYRSVSENNQEVKTAQTASLVDRIKKSRNSDTMK